MKIVHLCHKGVSVTTYMPLSKSVKFSYPSTWLVKTDQTLFQKRKVGKLLWVTMASRTDTIMLGTESIPNPLLYGLQ
jgi:hypothetical protein